MRGFTVVKMRLFDDSLLQCFSAKLPAPLLIKVLQRFYQIHERITLHCIYKPEWL